MPLIIILDFGNESSAGLTFIYDMIILNLGNEGAAVIIFVLGNKGIMGLTSIYTMIILDMGDECAAGFTSGPLGHEKQKDPTLALGNKGRPWWPGGRPLEVK